MAKNLRADLWIDSEVKQYSHQSSAKAVPAVPTVTNDRLHLTAAQVVKMQRSSLLLASEDPLARSVSLLMSVEDQAQWRDNWDRVFRFWSFSFALVSAPDGCPNVKELAVVISPP
ncbi:MAG: hypothetical protein WA239_17150 [Candidatus Sulfotelmatobacter sp.]